MAGKYTKQTPNYVYYVGKIGEGGWIEGPFVNPKRGYENHKYKVIPEQEYIQLLEDAMKYRSLKK